MDEGPPTQPVAPLDAQPERKGQTNGITDTRKASEMNLQHTADTFTPDTELSHGAYRLLRVIRAARAHTDRRGRVLRRVGQGYLAARCGHVSKRQVRRYLGELEAGGRVLRVAHRRTFEAGRWWSIETQAYVVLEAPGARVSAGHTDRTSLSGRPYRGRGTRGPGGPRVGAAPPETLDTGPKAPREVALAHIAAIRKALRHDTD